MAKNPGPRKSYSSWICIILAKFSWKILDVSYVTVLGRETGRGPLARVDRRTLGSSTRAALLWNSPQGPPSEERRTDAAENKEEKGTLMGVTILFARGALHMGHYVYFRWNQGRMNERMDQLAQSQLHKLLQS